MRVFENKSRTYAKYSARSAMSTLRRISRGNNLKGESIIILKRHCGMRVMLTGVVSERQIFSHICTQSKHAWTIEFFSPRISLCSRFDCAALNSIFYKSGTLLGHDDDLFANNSSSSFFRNPYTKFYIITRVH